MRAALAATLVCFASTLVYCARAEEGETPRAEAIKANFDKLVSEDKEVKREALLYFGKVDKTFAAEVPLFTASLKDKRNQVRAISAYALGKIGKAAVGALPEVEKLLTDSSATVQKYAKRALERLRPFRPVPKKPAPSKPTSEETIAVIKGLGGKLKFDKNKAVVSVDLTSVQVTDAGLVHLKGLTKLEKLHLDGTRVTDAGLIHLKGLTSLDNLSLTGTDVTDAGLVHLEGMTNLTGLSLGTRITDDGLVHLKGLTSLQFLFLKNTKVTDAGLKHLEGLANLLFLNLSDTKVADEGLVHLEGLSSLRNLALVGTKVTDAGVKKLQQALPKCRIYP